MANIPYRKSLYVGILLTILSLLENLLFYSPLMIFYTVLSILIPIKYRNFNYDFKIDYKIFLKYLLFSLLFTVVFFTVVNFTLAKLNLIGNYYYDINGCFKLFINTISLKFNISQDFVIYFLVFHLLIISPISEELFYRGYLLNGFGGGQKGIFLSSLLFAIRHLFHFLILPTYPIFSEMLYFISTFIYGIILSKSYLDSKNIFIPLLIHILSNILIVVSIFLI